MKVSRLAILSYDAAHDFETQTARCCDPTALVALPCHLDLADEQAHHIGMHLPRPHSAGWQERMRMCCSNKTLTNTDVAALVLRVFGEHAGRAPRYTVDDPGWLDDGTPANHFILLIEAATFGTTRHLINAGVSPRRIVVVNYDQDGEMQRYMRAMGKLLGVACVQTKTSFREFMGWHVEDGLLHRYAFFYADGTATFEGSDQTSHPYSDVRFGVRHMLALPANGRQTAFALTVSRNTQKTKKGVIEIPEIQDWIVRVCVRVRGALAQLVRMHTYQPSTMLYMSFAMQQPLLPIEHALVAAHTATIAGRRIPFPLGSNEAEHSDSEDEDDSAIVIE